MGTLVTRDVDRLDCPACAAQDRVRERAGLCGNREHAAIVVQVGMYVQQGRVERSGDALDHLEISTLGDVRGGEERRHIRCSPSTKRPRSSTGRPSTSRLPSSTTTSSWIGTDTVPPIAALP